MYRLEWIERRKLRSEAAPSSAQIASVSPVVWKLGLTSFLTDISSEMVNSALPVYLVLHLHLSPLQYGTIDGVYNGLSVVIVSLAAGLMADRWKRHKEVAMFGYGLSAVCKLLFFAAGGIWGWLIVATGLDRLGKGIRTSPRDALISLNTPSPLMASAFAVHRTLDAGGALLGPIVAFVLLALLPGGFDVLWLASFLIALLGLSCLWLYVPNPSESLISAVGVISRKLLSSLIGSRRFVILAVCGLFLAVGTVGDGFIYLILQERGGTNSGFLPLYYVATAASYMLFSIPAGICADKFGRGSVFLSGYALLGLIYFLLLWLPAIGPAAQASCLLLLGLYYAGTEGVLMAMASAVIPAELRTSGLAILVTAVALGKMVSSFLFGWLWDTHGINVAIITFVAILLTALPAAGFFFRVGGSR
ncbi:MAG: MFS transporter [Blastocatellia bacterium]|nr:MFS transporter [Blastocatellia bacterium]